MSKRDPRISDRPAPAPEAARGVPLPLVTQPMGAVSPPMDGGQLPRAVVPRHGDDEALALAMEGRPTVSMDASALHAQLRGAQAGRVEAAPVAVPVVKSQQPPPEIGLTQHHLPDDAPLDARLVLVDDPDSERAAAFRVLRHHLLEAGRPQVVVVSSPRPGEGKTTAAINLALALSECGRAKVLLVEANVRRPQLASVFRFVPPWCFAEQLAAHRHQPMLPWSLVDIPQLWLHVAAINPRLEQSQLLDAPAFAIAMDRLRLGGYDHIVIDSPSVLGSADVNLIQDAADGAILVLRGRTSTARELRQAVDQLSPAKIIGTVLLER